MYQNFSRVYTGTHYLLSQRLACVQRKHQGIQVTHIVGPAPCKRGNLGPCPRPWRGATTDRSTAQQLARFRALQDPGDEGQGVGRGGGEDTYGDRRQEADRKAGASGMRTIRTTTKILFHS